MSSADNLIAGVWEAGASARDPLVRTPPHDPSGETFVIRDASKGQVDRAVAGARVAQQEWFELSVIERADAIASAAGVLRSEANGLAEVLTLEVGKTIPEATGEILNAARLLEFHAGSALRNHGAVITSGRPRTKVTVEWEPLGVVAAVTPWNFPINLAVVKLAAALAAGNGLVLKPSPEAGYTSSTFVRVIADCFPTGLIGLVQGRGEVGQMLIEQGGVDGVTFTGSTAVGRRVSSIAAAKGIPFQCEMGGRNTITIMKSADLDVAVPAVAGSAFRMAGQKCTAAGSLVVHEDIYDEVIGRLLGQLDSGSFALGDPHNPATAVGPLIGPDAASRVASQVMGAVASGARLAWPLDGVLTDESLSDSYLRPALLADVTQKMEIMRTEVFGPVLTVLRTRSAGEAAELANIGGHGLVSAIFTADLAEAMAYSAKVRAGTVLVNQPTTGLDYHVPFGGWGLSGQGPTEQSDDALKVYMRPKTRYLSWADTAVGR